MRSQKHCSSHPDLWEPRYHARGAGWWIATKFCRRAEKREKKMQHLDEGTIHSWLDGALSADEAARVEAHVAECPQCATAVAEARGFIAASSRILTAVDHVTRGVVPAAPPVKWYNRAAWRAAAAVLVVGVGSLVVVRNGGKNVSESSIELRETPDTAPIPKPAPPIIISAS